MKAAYFIWLIVMSFSFTHCSKPVCCGEPDGVLYFSYANGSGSNLLDPNTGVYKYSEIWTEDVVSEQKSEKKIVRIEKGKMRDTGNKSIEYFFDNRYGENLKYVLFHLSLSEADTVRFSYTGRYKNIPDTVFYNSKKIPHKIYQGIIQKYTIIK